MDVLEQYLLERGWCSMTLTPNSYQIVLKDAAGVQLCPSIDNFVSAEYTRSVNNVGACKLVMSDSDIIKTVNSWDKFHIDGRVEFWRSVNGSPLYLDGETVYFIRKVERDLAEDGSQTMTFTGEDTISLLNRRTAVPDTVALAAYYNVSVAKEADDVLKDIFCNYLGANADTVATAAYGNTPAGTGVGFRLDSYITQQVNLTSAPQTTKKFQNRNVLQVMQEIAQASATLGTYLAFDIVSDGQSMQFRTYTGQRGLDRRASTSNMLLIGPEVGNVLACHYEDDHNNEATYLVSGAGVPTFSSEREGISLFGRIMRNIPPAASGTAAQQTAYTNSQLRYNRPKKLFTANMIQTEGCLYGKHYGYGDYITASAWGQQFDCHLDALDIKIQNGEEDVTCLFRGEYQAWL
jgi:hypothetical protein